MLKTIDYVVIGLLLIAFGISIMIAPVTAASVTSNQPSYITRGDNLTCILFNGTSENVTTGWFEYGALANGDNIAPDNGTLFGYTRERRISGDFHEVVCGIKLTTGKNYIFQAVGKDSSNTTYYGRFVTFTGVNLTPATMPTHQQQNNDQPVDPIFNMITPFLNIIIGVIITILFIVGLKIGGVI